MLSQDKAGSASQTSYGKQLCCPCHGADEVQMQDSNIQILVVDVNAMNPSGPLSVASDLIRIHAAASRFAPAEDLHASLSTQGG